MSSTTFDLLSTVPSWNGSANFWSIFLEWWMTCCCTNSWWKQESFSVSWNTNWERFTLLNGINCIIISKRLSHFLLLIVLHQNSGNNILHIFFLALKHSIRLCCFGELINFGLISIVFSDCLCNTSFGRVDFFQTLYDW